MQFPRDLTTRTPQVSGINVVKCYELVVSRDLLKKFFFSIARGSLYFFANKRNNGESLMCARR